MKDPSRDHFLTTSDTLPWTPFLQCNVIWDNYHIGLWEKPSSAAQALHVDTQHLDTPDQPPRWDLHPFRERAFTPKLPVLLPQDVSKQPPASQSWFESMGESPSSRRLKYDYLNRYGDVIVALELTRKNEAGTETFERFNAPLELFLNWMMQQRQQQAETKPDLPLASPPPSLYLAQCQISHLPESLQTDLPTPDLVLQAGKGDVYSANIWIGTPPTYTPLHRDPNPNFFLQLAGRKLVRLFPPHIGLEIFSAVQAELGRNGSAMFRGEEMMQGTERGLLEKEVWGDGDSFLKPSLDLEGGGRGRGYEATVEAGNALFIPLGWWHSIKSVGAGTTASVNWWFR